MQHSKTSFYIVAHADDWQLFMQPDACRDLRAPDTKVIFIITTAGDAGLGAVFWAAREEGHKSSIRFCLAPHEEIFEAPGRKEINGHAVHFTQINKTITYFLRLPDGGLDGKSFEQNGWNSLSKFNAGEIPKLRTLDGSAVYDSWEDLSGLVTGIIREESREANSLHLHYLNPDCAVNPGDHPDHAATGTLVKGLTNCRHVCYAGYNGSDRVGITEEEQFWKVGMFAAYEKAVWDEAGYSTLREDRNQYLKWIYRA